MINRTILNTALQKSYYANEANNKQILSSYSEQPIELKNESIPVPTLVAYMINNAFKNAIKTRSSQLSQFITSCPEMAVEHSTELLEFLDSILEKGIPEGKLNIIGAIINALAPEPGSLSLSSAESSFKTSISTSSTAADPQSPRSACSQH